MINNDKNILGKKLQKCSISTGFYRDGFCSTGIEDFGTHTVCAKMDEQFMNYTKSKGNDLSNVVKSNQNWCICEDRWNQAFKDNKAPQVLINSTNIKTKNSIKNNILKHKRINNTKKGGTKRKIKNNQTKKQQFLYNPNDPKKSFDVYIDKDPSDTIPIKYTTINDVKNTIKNLEKLFKNGKYPHKRIWQVGMIMKVRLEAMKKHKKTLYPNAKYVNQRFTLANRYFKFLGQRSKKNTFQERKKMVFNIN